MEKPESGEREKPCFTDESEDESVNKDETKKYVKKKCVCYRQDNELCGLTSSERRHLFPDQDSSNFDRVLHRNKDKNLPYPRSRRDDYQDEQSNNTERASKHMRRARNHIDTADKKGSERKNRDYDEKRKNIIRRKHRNENLHEEPPNDDRFNETREHRRHDRKENQSKTKKQMLHNDDTMENSEKSEEMSDTNLKKDNQHSGPQVKRSPLSPADARAKPSKEPTPVNFSSRTRDTSRKHQDRFDDNHEGSKDFYETLDAGGSSEHDSAQDSETQTDDYENSSNEQGQSSDSVDDDNTHLKYVDNQKNKFFDVKISGKKTNSKRGSPLPSTKLSRRKKTKNSPEITESSSEMRRNLRPEPPSTFHKKQSTRKPHRVESVKTVDHVRSRNEEPTVDSKRRKHPDGKDHNASQYGQALITQNKNRTRNQNHHNEDKKIAYSKKHPTAHHMPKSSDESVSPMPKANQVSHTDNRHVKQGRSPKRSNRKHVPSRRNQNSNIRHKDVVAKNKNLHNLKDHHEHKHHRQHLHEIDKHEDHQESQPEVIDQDQNQQVRSHHRHENISHEDDSNEDVDFQNYDLQKKNNNIHNHKNRGYDHKDQNDEDYHHRHDHNNRHSNRHRNWKHVEEVASSDNDRMIKSTTPMNQDSEYYNRSTTSKQQSQHNSQQEEQIESPSHQIQQQEDYFRNTLEYSSPSINKKHVISEGRKTPDHLRKIKNLHRKMHDLKLRRHSPKAKPKDPAQNYHKLVDQDKLDEHNEKTHLFSYGKKARKMHDHFLKLKRANITHIRKKPHRRDLETSERVQTYGDSYFEHNLTYPVKTKEHPLKMHNSRLHDENYPSNSGHDNTAGNHRSKSESDHSDSTIISLQPGRQALVGQSSKTKFQQLHTQYSPIVHKSLGTQTSMTHHTDQEDNRNNTTTNNGSMDHEHKHSQCSDIAVISMNDCLTEIDSNDLVSDCTSTQSSVSHSQTLQTTSRDDQDYLQRASHKNRNHTVDKNSVHSKRSSASFANTQRSMSHKSKEIPVHRIQSDKALKVRGLRRSAAKTSTNSNASHTAHKRLSTRNGYCTCISRNGSFQFYKQLSDDDDNGVSEEEYSDADIEPVTLQDEQTHIKSDRAKSYAARHGIYGLNDKEDGSSHRHDEQLYSTHVVRDEILKPKSHHHDVAKRSSKHKSSPFKHR